MKKQIITLIGVTILSVTMLTACGGRNQENSNTETTQEITSDANSENIISEDEAKGIALKDAGVNEADVTRIRVSRDFDDGRQEYDVDFYVGTQEYEYTISAEDGFILDKDTDIDNDFD